MDKLPTCIVPSIGDPVLYAKGLVVDIIVFNNKYQDLYNFQDLIIDNDWVWVTFKCFFSFQTIY
jgi:hypothetical protein